MVILFSIFWGTSILFSKVATQTYILKAVHEGSVFSTSSPTLVISSLFTNSHSNRYEVNAHCIFDLLIINDVEHLFMYLYVFFREMSVQIFCPFKSWIISILSYNFKKFQLVSYMNSLYILDISLLPDIRLVDTFPFCGLLFHFVDGFLYCAEVFSLIYSFVFAFVAFVFGVKFKKIITKTYVKEVTANVFF